MHDHGHDHTINANRAFAVGVALNLAFVAVEAGYGVAAGSLALVTDAGHNLSDVGSLLLAWGAAVLASRRATEGRTYGYRKATVLASLASAVLLLVALGAIAWEAVARLLTPREVGGRAIVVVAAIGVVVNTATALLFVRGRKHDLNLRGAFLHMAADAAVSLGVVVAGVIIMLEGWTWVDPVVSLVIVVVVLVGTWRLLRDATNYALDAVPPGVAMGEVRAYLRTLEGVTGLHDLHVWPLSTTETALTVHLEVAGGAVPDDFLRGAQEGLQNRFGIGHATIQVEAAAAPDCCLVRDCGDG